MKLLVKFHANPEVEVKKHIFKMYCEEVETRYENYFLKSPYELVFNILVLILNRQPVI
jgi:hypothetical protein